MRHLGQVLSRDRTTYPTPRAFISFSKPTGQHHMEKASRLLLSEEFEVVTGFDRAVQIEKNLRALKNSIADCSVFLGIWTKTRSLDPTLHGRQENGDSHGIPSPWMLEEKGIAEAFNKPMRLLVHESIPQEYVNHVTYGDILSYFNDTDFESKLREAADALRQRYQEILQFEQP